MPRRALGVFVMACLFACVLACPLGSGAFAQSRPPSDASAPTFELAFVASAAGIEPPALQRPALLGALDIADARRVTQRKGSLVYGTTYEHEVWITLVPAAAARLTETTANAAGRRVAIVVDGRVRQQMVLMGPLAGREIAIAGSFTESEADALAKRLREAATARR